MRVLCLLLAVAFLAPLHSVTAQSPSRPTFEVAIVRLSKPGQPGGLIKPLPNGGGYTAQNMTVKVMISLMYRVPMRQIQGGPEWLNSERFDVEAKADRSYSTDELHVMYQNLLEDRFGLKLHKETRQGPVYLLSVDPAGAKMKVNESKPTYEIPISGAPEHVQGTRVPMPYFCWWLGQVLQADERPVVDGTGLDKNYDFTLSFRPQVPPGEALSPEMQDLPPIFTALKDQLGLKLQPQKGPVEYLVIDHLGRPSEN